MTEERTNPVPLWREMGLKDEEYKLIVEKLGREPNYTELGMFAVLWSEHCAYKHSKSLLRGLPTQGEKVLVGPGENAGVVDIGHGLACAFKIESHNHPSAIEPYEGAATGIGGIVRDILAMGAKPVAALDSLRFGPLTDERTRFLLKGVIEGAADYCNTLGLAGVGGETWFGEPYRQNPLVNVFCAGILKHEDLHRGGAYGVGNVVMIVGRATGRDGIHACTFASEELDEDTQANVPKGHPVTGRKLIAACLEMMKEGAVVGVQDMGAAGITSSSAETASRAGTGLAIEASRVPVAEEGMTPYEIMLSETQERMLLIVKPGMVDRVESIGKKWGLNAQAIGEVTGSGCLQVLHNGQEVASIPVSVLAEGAPVYTPEWAVPGYIDENAAFDFSQVCVPETEKLRDILLDLLASPNIASKEPLYTSFLVSDPVTRPGYGAPITGVEGTNKALAFSVDCNGKLVYLNPRGGTAWAVAEAARNVAVTGAQPVALTNGLNFGNPEKPEIYWQLKEAVSGMSEACRALGIPVTGGNVSLYNETGGQPIYPTPIIGMLGIIDDVEKRISPSFKEEGDIVALLGEIDSRARALSGSEYLERVHGLVAGSPCDPDLQLEKRIIGALVEGTEHGLFQSAQDLSEGGLAVTLAECCILGSGKGATVCVPQAEAGEDQADSRIDAALFGEPNSAVVVSFKAGFLSAVERLCRKHSVPFHNLGTVGGDSLAIKDKSGRILICAGVAEMKEPWQNGIKRFMS